MEKNSLQHYGVLGMKWGIRRTPAQLGRSKSKNATSEEVVAEKKSLFRTKAKASKEAPKKRTVKDLTDEELNQKIRRLELEKRYKDLAKQEVKPTPKGKAFVMNVLEQSGKNIATQLTTYAMGRAVNKVFADVFDDPAIVNPKKGQKDK